MTPAKILWAVSYFGTGHAYRNLVVAAQLQSVRPGVQIQFASAGEVPAIIRDAGYRCRSDLVYAGLPLSDGRLSLPGFVRAWMKKERGNLPIYLRAMRQQNPDLVVSDELPSLLSAAAQMQIPSVYLTDFLTIAPVRRSRIWQVPLHGFFELFRPLLRNRLRRSYRQAEEVVYFGEPQDADENWRQWAEENVHFAGAVVREMKPLQPPVHRRLQISKNAPLITVTAGGSDAGEHLLRAAARSLPQILDHIPRAVMLLVAGPAISPEHLRSQLRVNVPPNQLRVRGFLPQLITYMAASDVVVTLAGHATLNELYIRTQTPAIVCPLGRHWEQERNALDAAGQGWAEVIFRDQLSPSHLARKTLQILGGKLQLRRKVQPPEPDPCWVARLLAGHLPGCS